MMCCPWCCIYMLSHHVVCGCLHMCLRFVVSVFVVCCRRLMQNATCLIMFCDIAIRDFVHSTSSARDMSPTADRMTTVCARTASPVTCHHAVCNCSRLRVHTMPSAAIASCAPTRLRIRGKTNNLSSAEKDQDMTRDSQCLEGDTIPASDSQLRRPVHVNVLQHVCADRVYCVVDHSTATPTINHNHIDKTNNITSYTETKLITISTLDTKLLV